MVIKGDNDSGGSVGSDNMYRERVKSVLVLLFNSYFKDKILIYDSRFSSCLTYMFY